MTIVAASRWFCTGHNDQILREYSWVIWIFIRCNDVIHQNRFCWSYADKFGDVRWCHALRGWLMSAIRTLKLLCVGWETHFSFLFVNFGFSSASILDISTVQNQRNPSPIIAPSPSPVCVTKFDHVRHVLFSVSMSAFLETGQWNYDRYGPIF